MHRLQRKRLENQQIQRALDDIRRFCQSATSPVEAKGEYRALLLLGAKDLRPYIGATFPTLPGAGRLQKIDWSSYATITIANRTVRWLILQR